MQLADPFIVNWAIETALASRALAGRAQSEFRVCVAAPAYVGSDLAHQRDQVRWFGGMVGNHVADIVERYGSDSSIVPPALTDYIRGRKGYDYSHHGKADNPDVDFVPDEIIDRFCVLGEVGQHREKLSELSELGVDQFSLYLMHDDPEGTIDAYRKYIIGQV
jgi:alkanesulfonate monooxygenase SsuD/methylene tetrahydromethanopterin reductase-like flavin-dependent oxidoreductase (luciferase family)